MKRMYTFETRYFPMIKNSWGWIKEEIYFVYEFKKDSSFINLEQNLFSFEEIEEFFKVY
jgi:hypothetical protein